MRVDRTVRVIVDPRGKIRTGYKDDRGLPVKAGHFVIHDWKTGKMKFPEIAEAYGDKPTSFYVACCSDDMSVVFNDDYSLWGSNEARIRSCNGETCLHVIDEVVGGKKFVAGEESECVCKKFGLMSSEDKDIKKKACRVDMTLKLYIYHPKTKKVLNPLPYLFVGHSIHSADQIAAMLSQIKNLKQLVFQLSLDKHKSNKRVYYLWRMVPVIDPQVLIAQSLDMGLPRLPENIGEPELSEDENVEEYEDAEFSDGEVVLPESLSGIQVRIQQCVSEAEVSQVVFQVKKSVDEAYHQAIESVGNAQIKFIKSVAEKEKQG